MPGKDQLTKQGPMFGNNRSHALNKTRRKYHLNTQKVTLLKNGRSLRLRVAAKTARTLRKQGKVVGR